MASDAGSPTAWQGTARAAPGLWLLLAVIGVGVSATMLFDSTAGPASAIPLVVAVAIGACFASLRVDVTSTAVEVRSGGLGWPRLRLPLDEIASVEATDIRPMRWGGWGYRGSRTLFKRAAWIVRAGPGLVVSLRDGSRLAVTVDQATAGAAAIEGLLAPRPPAA